MQMIFENRVTVCGKAVKDPMFNKTKSDKSVCKVIIVVEKKIGHMKRADFIPIAMWGRKADVANDLIRKGDQVMVTGSVAQERWETSDHDKRSRIVVQADKFWVIPPPNCDDDYIDEDQAEDDVIEKLEARVGEADSAF